MNSNRKRMLRKYQVLEAGADQTPNAAITSGAWGKIEALSAEVVLSAYTDAERIGDLPAGGITLAAGQAIHGKITQVTVASGDVCIAWEYLDGFAE